MLWSYDMAVDAVRSLYDWRIAGQAILNADREFPDASRFHAGWRRIREEALTVAAGIQRVPRFHEVMPEQRSISANDGRDWRMFILKAYGRELTSNMASCRTLADIVRTSPDVLSASFSFLGPGKHIPAHRGPIRGIIRFYLVLSMPCTEGGEPAAVLKIAGAEHRLAEGQFLVWDDTFEHEAWNESDRLRIVLSLDVWRRSMPLDMKLLTIAIIGLVRLSMRLRHFARDATIPQ
jgi:aspartate beta-hydroxylase